MTPPKKRAKVAANDNPTPALDASEKAWVQHYGHEFGLDLPMYGMVYLWNEPGFLPGGYSPLCGIGDQGGPDNNPLPALMDMISLVKVSSENQNCEEDGKNDEGNDGKSH